MREELHEFLDGEIAKMEGGKRWVYRNLSFNYQSLAKEVRPQSKCMCVWV